MLNAPSCSFSPLGDADAGPDRGDQRLHFGVLQHLIETRFLHVDDLAFDREDRLETPVAPLLRRTACGVALDDVELGQRGIALGAVRQFAGQTSAGERAFAHRFASFARRLARAGSHEAFLDDPFPDVSGSDRNAASIPRS